MTNDPPPRFDPRFNPAFQPGFEPGTDDAGSPPRRPMTPPKRLSAVGGPPPPTVRPRSGNGAVNDGGIDGRKDLRTGSGVARPAAGNRGNGGVVGSGDRAPGGRGEPAYDRGDGRADGETLGAIETDSDSDPFPGSGDRSDGRPVAVTLAEQLRNPFLVVLAGLAVVLVGVGAWLFARTYAAFNDAGSFSTQGDFVALETLMRTSPLIIILGVGIAIGVVFLLAIGWRPRK